MEQGTPKDVAGKVEEMAINTTGQVKSNIRDKVEQGKAVWQDAKASARRRPRTGGLAGSRCLNRGQSGGHAGQ